MGRWDKIPNQKLGDKAYYPGKSKGPRVRACLVHPTIEAVMFHQVKDFEGYQTVNYGLCKGCEISLKMDKTFAAYLDKVICKRLTDMKPPEEGEENG